MNYPDHLLPKSNFNIINSEADLNNCFLIRNTPTKEICIPGTKFLNEEIVKIQSNHLGDFSTNLLDIFTEDDIKYEIKGENKDYFHSLWSEGENVEVPVYKKDFELNGEKGCFYLSIDELRSQSVSYPQDDPKIDAKCKVIHNPTNCNFWHFSLRWYTKDGQDIRNLDISSNQKRKFLSLTKALVFELALIDKPDYSKINSELYC